MLVLTPKLVAVLLTTGTLGALCTGPSIPKAPPPVSRPAPPTPTWPASAGEGVSGGDFTCSGLLPGVLPNLAGATPGTCNEAVTFSNTGTTTEDLDVILGGPYGSGPAVAALDQLLVSYTANDQAGTRPSATQPSGLLLSQCRSRRWDPARASPCGSRSASPVG